MQCSDVFKINYEYDANRQWIITEKVYQEGYAVSNRIMLFVSWFDK